MAKPQKKKNVLPELRLELGSHQLVRTSGKVCVHGIAVPWHLRMSHISTHRVRVYVRAICSTVELLRLMSVGWAGLFCYIYLLGV